MPDLAWGCEAPVVGIIVRGDDPEAAWEAEAEQLGWQTFAEACDRRAPNRLVDELEAVLDTPDRVAPAAALARWLDAAAVVEAPGLEDEAAPWLDQVCAEAVVDRRSLRPLAATRPALELDRDGQAARGEA